MAERSERSRMDVKYFFIYKSPFITCVDLS